MQRLVLAPLVAPWDSEAMLDGALADLAADPSPAPSHANGLYQSEMIENYESEYDSRFFEAFLRSRDDLSDDFLAFLDAWREDEVRHSHGFARIYAALYGDDLDAIWHDLPNRATDSDFGPVAHLFPDEFHILAIFAFDELCTTRAYCRERDQFFDEYADGRLKTWLSNVARDEAYHLANCLRLLRVHHGERLHEVPDVYRKLRAQAHLNLPYSGTFVLDQGLYLDDPDEVLSVMEDVCSRLLGKTWRDNFGADW